MQNKDIRTQGYVLRRTNYGEADRILSIITPLGKISAIAKGVRKAKAKLAGNVEMFTLSDYNIRTGRSGLGVVTGAKMVKHYGEIIKDLSKMELAAMILKKMDRAAEHSESTAFFEIVDQGLAAINNGEDLRMIETWCLLNLKKVMGEEMNLYRDKGGVKLLPEKRYDWDVMESAFFENKHGEYGADEIKIMRLMVSNNYEVVRRIKVDNEMPERILRLVRIVV